MPYEKIESASPPVSNTCGHCGAARTNEEIELSKTFGRLHCTGCFREGCFECMPAGRGVICPECEEQQHSEEYD